MLRVDLAEKKIVKEALPEEWMRKYIGCRGINDIILPDSLYNLFLKPIAKRLKIKHIFGGAENVN